MALGKTGDRKILPLLEALREGSVFVRSLPGGKKETVIVGDKVSEGDKTLVPLFTAYGREPILAPDGKPLLAGALDAGGGRHRAEPALWPCVRSSTPSPAIPSSRTPTGPCARRPPPRWATRAISPRCRALERGAGQGEGPLGALRARAGHRADPAQAGSEAERTAAATALGDLGSADALEPPAGLAAESAGAAAALRQAAADAVKRVERWALLTSAIQIGFQGLSLGSILLLMALGLAIVFGLMGVINMAHGELMALGAYATFVMQGLFAAHAPGASTTTSWSRCRCRSWWRPPRASRWSAGSSASSTGGRSRPCS